MNLVTIEMITIGKRTTIGVTDASHQEVSHTLGEVQEVSNPFTKHLQHPHQILQELVVVAADLAVIASQMVDFLPVAVPDKIAASKIINLI